MAVNRILNATIEQISRDRNNTLVTAMYRDRGNQQRQEQRIRMVVGDNTVVVLMNGSRGNASDLREGMVINAIVSNAVTRSIPPQADAFFIEIVSEGMESNISTGRIVDVDRKNRSFTTICDCNFTSIVRYQVPEGTPIINSNGRNIDFNSLFPGLRVEVRHGNFMTASIPPQTTAYEVKVL